MAMKPKTKASKPGRDFIRFHADASLSEEIQALHSALSTKKWSGETIERLVKASLRMATGEKLQVPPDILEMRRALGLSSDAPQESEVRELAKTMAGMLDQMKNQADQTADLIKVLDRRR